MSQSETLFDDVPSVPRTPSWATRLAAFDLETTGVDVAHDRIVTACVALIGPSGEVASVRTWLADPGVEIPAGATAVHGVTTERARAEGAPASRVVAEIVDELRALLADGTPLVVYNAPFDLSLLAAEAHRHGIPPLSAPLPVIDPLVVDKQVDRYRRGKRTLDAVSAHYGVALDDAHDARADAVAAGLLAQEIGRRHGDDLPGSAAELHHAQIGWARDQAASLTEYLIRVSRMQPSESVDGSWPQR